eukprot:364994-Chlamydomonas_euryale.AAC.3
MPTCVTPPPPRPPPPSYVRTSPCSRAARHAGDPRRGRKGMSQIAGHTNPTSTPGWGLLTPTWSRPSGRHNVPSTRLGSDKSTGVRRGRTPCNAGHHQLPVSLLFRSSDQRHCDTVGAKGWQGGSGHSFQA